MYATHNGVFSLRAGRLRASYGAARTAALRQAHETARALEPERSLRRLPWTELRRRALSATGIIDALHDRPSSSPFSDAELSAIFVDEPSAIPA